MLSSMMMCFAFFLSHSSFYYINIPSHPHPLTLIIRRLGGNTHRGCTKIGSITTLFKQMTPTLPWRTTPLRFRPRATDERGMTRKKKKRFVLLPCLVVSCWCFVSLYCHSTIGVLNCEQPKKHLRERTRTKHTHTEARAYARLRNIGSPKGKPQNEHITADKHKNHVRQLAAMNVFCWALGWLEMLEFPPLSLLCSPVYVRNLLAHTHDFVRRPPPASGFMRRFICRWIVGEFLRYDCIPCIITMVRKPLTKPHHHRHRCGSAISVMIRW